MKRHSVDALVCARPTSVLILSGYWPVAGNTIAIATADSVTLLTPTDELSLASSSDADDVRGYELGSLSELKTFQQAVETPLHQVLAMLNLGDAAIGIEESSRMQPAPYAAMNVPGNTLAELLRWAVPRARLVAADELMDQLRLIKTDQEIGKIRHACNACASAFEEARAAIRPGATEIQVAQRVRTRLMEPRDPRERCDGFAFCMSGPNAARASKFFQQSGLRTLCPGDLALVHCNSHVNGYWTDVTRTFHLGEPSSKTRGMYEAIFAAREAALAAIRPFAACSAIDHAARQVLETRGFGKEFKHSLGHGVGFSAIDHNAMPRLHPVSPDVMREGMVFNIEPAIYIDGCCGMRHCDVVACRANGPELLTDFQSSVDHLLC